MEGVASARNTQAKIGGSTICRVCKKADVTGHGWHKLVAWEWGTMADIFQRRSCPFCASVLQLLPVDILSELSLGRNTNVLRRCLLQREYKSADEAVGVGVYIDRIKPGGYRGSLRFESPHLRSYLHTSFANVSSLFEEKSLDFDLIKRCVQRCQEQHTSYDLGHLLLPDLMTITLIDVINSCLITVPMFSQAYVALSYVWGGTEMLTLRKDNVMKLRQEGILERIASEVPPTIRDAIMLTQRLSQQYLWVDSLCIVQDSDDKHRQISDMDTIYSSALLTVIAASAQDARSSLPGVRNQSRSCRPPARYVGNRKLTYHAKGTPTALLDTLAASTYETRGWTFQERILSTRCLIISDQELFYVCHIAAKEPILCSDRETASTALRGNAIRGSLALIQDSVREGSWLQIARLTVAYTQRHLTYQHDKLNAFTGLMSAMASMHDIQFCYGLPIIFIQHALLWAPADSRYTNHMEGRCRIPGFPSWSWAGWICPIRYDYTSKSNEPWPWDLQLKESVEISIGETLGIAKNSIDPAHHESSRGPLPQSQREPMKKQLSFRTKTIDLRRFTFALADGMEGIEADIFLENGTKCGQIRGDGVLREESIESQIQPKYQRWCDEGCCFIYLSRQQYFDSAVKDSLTKNQFPKFEHREWTACNVLLITPKGDHVERVAIAQVHLDAWNSLDPEEVEIKLI